MLQNIIDKFQSDEDEVRRSSVQWLRNFPFEEVFTLLLQAIGDTSWRVRKEAVDVFVSAKPSDQQINALLELLRSDDNAGQRNSAAEAVIRLGLCALPSLVKRLNDPDADVRKFVIDVMGSINNQECVTHLLGSLMDPDINVAAAAAEQLGNLADNTAVQPLIEAVVTIQDDFFRYNALAAIGKLAAPIPVPPEIVSLVSNEILRKPVYECLGSIADEKFFPFLIEGLSAPQKSCRYAALVALFRIIVRSPQNVRMHFASEMQQYQGSSLVISIMDLYSSSDSMRAEAAVTLLDFIGDVRAVHVFLQAFSDDRLMSRALQAIKGHSPHMLEHAFSLYDDSDEMCRAAICLLCSECKFPDGSGIVRKGLKDFSSLVRQAAAITAGRLGLIGCLDELVELLHDDESVSNAAIGSLQSLALIDSKAIKSVTESLCHSESSALRRTAALLSAALGDGDRLMLLVKDENPQVRQAAVNAMKATHLTGIENILVMALVDEDPDVRIAAADAIGETGGFELVSPLVSAMEDNDVWVRCAALKSLVKISPETGFSEIQRVFSNASGLLLITCLQLLEFLASNESLALVASVMEHQDRDVASLAREIVSRLARRQVAA